MRSKLNKIAIGTATHNLCAVCRNVVANEDLVKHPKEVEPIHTSDPQAFRIYAENREPNKFNLIIKMSHKSLIQSDGSFLLSLQSTEATGFDSHGFSRTMNEKQCRRKLWLPQCLFLLIAFLFLVRSPILCAESVPANASGPISSTALDISTLARQPQLWPREVTLSATVQIPLVLNGKKMGDTQLSPGRVVVLRKVNTDGTVEIDFQGSSAIVQAAATDLMARTSILSAAATAEKKRKDDEQKRGDDELLAHPITTINGIRDVASQPKLWPQQVTLLGDFKFRTTNNGPIFAMPKGSVVTLVTVNPDGTVEIQGGGPKIKIAAEYTDVMVRAQGIAADLKKRYDALIAAGRSAGGAKSSAPNSDGQTTMVASSPLPEVQKEAEEKAAAAKKEQGVTKQTANETVDSPQQKSGSSTSQQDHECGIPPCKVIQTLDNGLLLYAAVEDKPRARSDAYPSVYVEPAVILLTGYPDDVVDDEFIKYCVAKYAGTFQYTTTGGSTKTVRKFAFVRKGN